MKKIFISVLLFFLLSMTTLVVIKASKSGFSFDTRSRASEAKKEKVYPVTAGNFNSSIPSYHPDAFVTYIKNNPTAPSIPDDVYVGLYLPKGGTCGDTKKNCIDMTIENKVTHVTSCVKVGFDLVQNTAITVRYKQSKGPVNEANCQGEWCGTSPGLHMYLSQDGSTWIRQTKSIPHSWSNSGDASDGNGAYKTVTMEPNAKYKYILLCRASGGYGRDSMLINTVYTEKTVTHTPTPTKALIKPTAASTRKPSSTFIIYMAPNGKDTNDGASKQTPIKSLTQAHKILQKEKPNTNVEIRIAKGTYYDNAVRWTYYNANHSISFMPEDYIIGSSFDTKLMPTFEGKHESAWLLRASIDDGKPTNLHFYYLKIQNYINGISLTGNRNNVNTWNGYNKFYGITFENIGTHWKTSSEMSVGVIDMSNSRYNTIENCTFKSILTAGNSLHSVYMAHYSSNNTITNNTFIDSSGSILKTRDYSNNNTMTYNTFDGSVPFRVFEDWYCNHEEREDCTKNKTSGVVGECPSWNNVLKNNTLNKGKYDYSELDWKKILYDGQVPLWCSKPTSTSSRVSDMRNIIK